MTPGTLQWSGPAEPQSAAEARARVLEFLREREAPDPLIGDIALVVTEAVANAICHAYVDRPRGDVRVSVDLRREELCLTIEDDGGGFKPRGDSPGLGLGLGLMDALADRLEAGPGPGAGTRIRTWWFHRDG